MVLHNTAPEHYFSQHSRRNVKKKADQHVSPGYRKSQTARAAVKWPVIRRSLPKKCGRSKLPVGLMKELAESYLRMLTWPRVKADARKAAEGAGKK